MKQLLSRLPLSLQLTLANLLARAAHLLLFLYVGNRFGANADTDSVFFVYAPALVLSAIAASVADVIIMPAMHRAVAEGCAARLLRSLRLRVLLVTLPMTALVLSVAAQLVATGLPVLLALGLVPLLAAQAAIQAGVLNAQGRYIRAAWGPLGGAAASLLILLLLPTTAVSLALSLAGFELGRLLVLWLQLAPVTDRAGPVPSQLHSLLSWAYRGASWQVVGAGLMALNPMIGLLFARRLEPGSISLLEYAGRLWNVVPLLFTGYLTILYARLSREAAQSAVDAAAVSRSALGVGAVALLASFLFMLASPLLVELAYQRGALAESAQQTLAVLLCIFLAAVAPYLAGQVYVRALSAEGRVSVLTGSALVNVCVNIGVNLLLMHPLGLYAIPLAAVAGYLAGLVVLVLSYRR